MFYFVVLQQHIINNVINNVGFKLKTCGYTLSALKRLRDIVLFRVLYKIQLVDHKVRMYITRQLDK